LARGQALAPDVRAVCDALSGGGTMNHTKKQKAEKTGKASIGLMTISGELRCPVH
jgi:hypothetical protein